MEVTRGQAATVVVNFMRSNPERLHEPFVNLVMTAMSKAWPCR